jgi:two-component system chemotaxis sensor kinase CheA
MDDLLSEFLTETNESMESLDVEVVRLEQEPNDPELLGSIFRLVHTIKGTCGFLGLPRLESVAHAGENILGKFRDGELPVTPEAVTLIFESLDQIKSLLATLAETEAEPDGDDSELIARLNAMADGKAAPAAAPAPAAEEPAPPAEADAKPEAEPDVKPVAAEADDASAEPAPSPVSSEPLIDRMGGLAAIDAMLDVMYRKIMKDADLAPFFESADPIILQGRMVEYMVAATGGSDNYSGNDLLSTHKHLVEQGLNDSHFDKFIGYMSEALAELEVPDDAMAEVLEIMGGTRDDVLNKAEMNARAAEEAKAKAEKEAAENPDAGQKKDSGVVQSVRVGVDLLENLMTMVSELVLSRNQLLQMVRKFEDSEFAAPLQRLSLITTDLQEGVMKTRMQPIGNAWSKLPRIVRDLSLDLDKKIDLEMVGAETELDRQVLEMIKDPLTHMVRNSGDHGIEMPADRLAAGKPETGSIVLRAFHEGGHIIIEIADDGRGINIEKVSEKIISNGLATAEELAEMSDKQITQYIFKAGFSTAEKVTNVSGRGVGMDVVRTNIEKIGGHVELNSETGKGSTFVVKIPLTLAIVSALIVDCAGEKFAIPQISVNELVRVSKESEHRIESINDTPVLRLRDRLLPLVALDEMLGLHPARDPAQLVAEFAEISDADNQPVTGAEAVSDDHAHEETQVESVEPAAEETFIVVARVGTSSFGIIVDQVFESEEIVVKPVTPVLREISIFSGNTILGDGSVIMILYPNGIASAIGETMSGGSEEIDEATMQAQERAAAERMAILVFRAGNEEPRAVPLALVARLEEVELDKIEEVDGTLVVQYRGQLMPLLTVDNAFKRSTEGRQHVIVFTDGDHSMGLMVDEIVDIVEDRLKVELSSGQKGVLGTAVISGKATEIIDTAYYLEQAFGDWFRKKKTAQESETVKSFNRVLLVDDSPFFRNLLTPLLSVVGYDVTAVEGAEKALSLRESGQQFDIIISDIEMPGMNGFELAEQIRSSGTWQETPLLALSSFSSRAELEKGREVGFADYIVKLDRDALLNSLDNTLTNLRGAA